MSQAVFACVWLLLAALALLLCPAIASAQERRHTFRIPFHTVNGLILLDGQLNGKPAALLLDTEANNSVVDYRAAGFNGLKLDALRSTGNTGAEGARSKLPRLRLLPQPRCDARGCTHPADEARPGLLCGFAGRKRKDHLLFPGFQVKHPHREWVSGTNRAFYREILGVRVR